MEFVSLGMIIIGECLDSLTTILFLIQQQMISIPKQARHCTMFLEVQGLSQPWVHAFFALGKLLLRLDTCSTRDQTCLRPLGEKFLRGSLEPTSSRLRID